MTLYWKKFNLQTLHIRCRNFEPLIVINVLTGIKYCPSVFETVVICVPTRKVRDFTMFSGPSATGLQLGVFLLQNQFVNIFLITHVSVQKALAVVPLIAYGSFCPVLS
jgi:hypothetical protein